MQTCVYACMHACIRLGPVGFATKPLHTMVYHGIPWYTMVYHGTPWYTMVFLWYTTAYHGVAWHTTSMQNDTHPISPVHILQIGAPWAHGIRDASGLLRSCDLNFGRATGGVHHLWVFCFSKNRMGRSASASSPEVCEATFCRIIPPLGIPPLSGWTLHWGRCLRWGRCSPQLVTTHMLLYAHGGTRCSCMSVHPPHHIAAKRSSILLHRRPDKLHIERLLTVPAGRPKAYSRPFLSHSNRWVTTDVTRGPAPTHEFAK